MQFSLQEGDVLVAASDGLFDNVWDDQASAYTAILTAPLPSPSCTETVGLCSGKQAHTAHDAPAHAYTTRAQQCAQACALVRQVPILLLNLCDQSL